MSKLVFTDDYCKEYQLANCNNFEIYRKDIGDKCYYYAWKSEKLEKSPKFYTLKKARNYARTH